MKSKEELIKEIIGEMNEYQEDKVKHNIGKQVKQIFENEKSIKRLHEENLKIKAALKEVELPTELKWEE